MKGLTEEEIKLSRKKYGTNELSKIEGNTFIKKFIETLGDPIIKILIIAVCVKTVFLFQNFDWFETVGIVIAIFLASLVSTISEYGSEQAFIRMQEESSKIKCKVKREGTLKQIDIGQVVVGDLVYLETGDKIPADGYLIKGNISVDESMITGETKEIEKKSGMVENKKNILYRGTTVYSNTGEMIVTKVGDKTFYGKIAKELETKSPTSPLKVKLTKLAKTISKIGYVGSILVFVSYLFSKIIISNSFDLELIISYIKNYRILIGDILYALTLSVTIIVVAVPEGLPMMITLVLSSNMKKMLRKNILVRKLVGIETAGSLNVLFTDKTGTLTKGKLDVVGFVDANLNTYNSFIEIEKYPIHKILEKSFYYNSGSKIDENGLIIGGNSTDKTIIKFLGKKIISNIDIIDYVPFNSENKYSSVKIKQGGGEITLYKGAPELILKKATKFYDKNMNKKFLDKKNTTNYLSDITKRGIRVVAFAVEEKKEFILLGFALIKDELRDETKSSIETIKNAGIQVVMITGDNKQTAYSIGKEIGLIESDSIILTSSELNEMSEEDIIKIFPKLRIVARALPTDKSKLVDIARKMNLVVGMTGDGVNDAPALKKADVGFAMGSGTEVAKEASDIIILDDNIASITSSILFGRTIFKSIRKFIIFQLTVNLCAISLSIIGPFIGVDTPVTVIQMLWINMVMDTLAGLAFSFEPAIKEYMYEPPKKKVEHIINGYMLEEIFITGLYSSILCILFLKLDIFKSLFITPENHMTAFFGLFIFLGIFNSFNARTVRINLFANISKNKVFMIIISFIIFVQIMIIYYGGTLFRTTGLSIKEFVIMIILSFTIIPVDWIRKLILRKKGVIGGV